MVWKRELKQQDVLYCNHATVSDVDADWQDALL